MTRDYEIVDSENGVVREIKEKQPYKPTGTLFINLANEISRIFKDLLNEYKR